MDRISSLPDEIIRHIGSFLSAKEAAFTTVLSKRWRDLFDIVTEVHFDDSANDGESISDFTVRVLALPVNTRIRKFSLIGRLKDSARVNCCLCHVLKLGVMDLELHLYGKKRGYSLPFEVFSCKTVAKLKLGSKFDIDFLPANAHLPSLKTLFLDSIRFSEFGRCAFNTLLSASPVLEELIINGVEFERWKWSSTVSSPTLQRLTIRREEWEPHDIRNTLDCRCLAHEFDSLSFDTPVLTYLEYYDYVPKEYPFVNLNSLIEAKLVLHVDYQTVWQDYHADVFNPLNLINGLKNVEILELDSDALYMIELFGKSIPVFENLLCLSVDLCDSCWDPLIILIKNSPKLKTLVIENRLHYANSYGDDEDVCRCVSEFSFLLSCPLEVQKIKMYDGTIEELELMKLFLEKLSCLKLLKVRAQVKDERKVQVMSDLLMLQRASSKCKIQVEFS